MTTITPDGPKHPSVAVQLTGMDSNAFYIISRVARALKRAGLHEAADEYRQAARACGSYDELLQLTMATVSVD